MRSVLNPRPTVPVSEAIAASPRKVFVDERSYEFITPVFGGGVRVDGARKHADPVTPVRVPSIRGQLRFWWRAVNPRRCATVEDLAKAEAEVFGAATGQTADVLDIAVKVQLGRPRELRVLVPGKKFGNERGMDEIAYGAFSLRDQDALQHGVLHEYAGAWTLTFTAREDLADDVAAALWAWSHFGGLGGRTRRGFGAIRQVEGAALPTIDEGWARWITHANRPEAPAWPTIKADREGSIAVAAQDFSTGLDAQKRLLGALRWLRQGEGGRKPQSQTTTGSPGRSYWPEPDASRSVMRTSAPSHSKRVTTVDAFPRAAFGMPVVFQFKDKGKSDPSDTHLKPVVDGKMKGRLASPLLLRPHARTDGRIEALALVLRHPPYESLALDRAGPRGKGVGASLTDAEAQTLRPMNEGETHFTDPLQRFLHLVRTGR
jgi:CRISPR-associated protein Cmr1